MIQRTILASRLSATAGAVLRGAAACLKRARGSVTRGQAAVAVVAAMLPLSAVLAGFAMTGEDAAGVQGSAAVETAAAPALRQITVNPAETTASLFARLGIADAALEKFVFSNVDAAAFAYPGRGFLAEAEVNPDGTARRVSLYLESRGTAPRRVTIARSDEGFAAENAPFAWEKHQFSAAAEVKGSAREAALKAGVPEAVISEAASVPYRSGKLLDTVKRGDLVSFAYETKSVGGHEAGRGKLLALSVTHEGKRTALFWLEDGTSRGGFYSADGASASGIAFRRYPLNSFRLTSPFSDGRRHPVTGRVRAHKGVDLAAPRGTPVYAVADGVVKAADRGLRGYGNRIDIRHEGGFSTRYAHLAGYASGIRAGTVVRQGQLIGYCGSTGLSTGSHVHYEILVNGAPRNPASVSLPEGKQLAAKYVAAARPRIRAIEGEFSRLASAAAKSPVIASAEFRANALATASAAGSSSRRTKG